MWIVNIYMLYLANNCGIITPSEEVSIINEEKQGNVDKSIINEEKQGNVNKSIINEENEGNVDKSIINEEN